LYWQAVGDMAGKPSQLLDFIGFINKDFSQKKED